LFSKKITCREKIIKNVIFSLQEIVLLAKGGTMKDGTFTIDVDIKKITLGAFQVGMDETNFQILCMLPTTIKEIMQETGLSKAPVNNRVKQLEKYSLAERDRHKKDGVVKKGDMTDLFIKDYNEMQVDVDKNVAKRLRCLI
jgi:predicted transcriptional regulator